MIKGLIFFQNSFF